MNIIIGVAMWTVASCILGIVCGLLIAAMSGDSDADLY